MTYTLLSIDRVNGSRTRNSHFKPQKGLTMEQLELIRERELIKMKKKHNSADIAVFLVYQEEDG